VHAYVRFVSVVFPGISVWSVLFDDVKDSLRYLVQDSLNNFTQTVVDACHSTMQCEEGMEWGEDVINSPYKYDIHVAVYVNVTRYMSSA